MTIEGERMNAVVGLSHAGIQVEDADRSIAFYEELGLTVSARWSNGLPYLQRLVGVPGVTLDVVVMAIPGSDAVLEILEYTGVERSSIDPATVNTGTGHVCFLVDDLDSMYERLRGNGVESVSPPQTPEIGPNAGGRVVYLKDPDGIRVELLQTSRTMTGEARGA
jgi:catechol 2,3-dioxygenase-like lactoylglutathione lyase family enzyme